MKIPKTWGDITIGQFQKLHSVQHGIYDFNFEKEIAVLSVLTNHTQDELESMPKTKVIELARATDFINQPLSEKLNSTFKIGRRRFKVLLEAEKISAEQFILLNRYTANDANSIENLHYILAVLTNEHRFFRKIQAFDHDFEAKAKLFQDKLSIEKAFAPSVFFCEVYKQWLNATETYLLKKANKIIQQTKQELMELM